MDEQIELSESSNKKWHANRPKEAFKLALLGLSEQQIADHMEISLGAISLWKREHDEFRIALRDGKTEADSNAAAALYKRAIGYEYDEDHVSIFKGVAVITTIKKHVPPDPWSAARWLSLRQSKLWSETHKLEVTNTNVNINKFDFSGLSTEDMLVIKKLGLKQLTDNVGGN